MSEHLTTLDPAFQIRLEELKRALAAKMGDMADTTSLAMAYLYRETQRQAAALAYNDVFYIQSLIFLGLVGTLWIMRKAPTGAGPRGGAH